MKKIDGISGSQLEVHCVVFDLDDVLSFGNVSAD